MKLINKYPFLFYGLSVVILQQIIQAAIPNYGDTFIIKALIELDPIWRYLFYIPGKILWTLNGGHNFAEGVYIALVIGFSVCLFLDFSIKYYSKILNNVSQLKSGKNTGKWFRKTEKEISLIQSKQKRSRFNPTIPISLFLFLNLIFTLLITPSEDNATNLWTLYSSVILRLPPILGPLA
ncbi:MAG: hypothetical protein HUN05_08700 [Desulfobacter sp.]|nr:MAG: hypothetical protein HUN05_08700 [Desulfobacter sp.]